MVRRPSLQRGGQEEAGQEEAEGPARQEEEMSYREEVLRNCPNFQADAVEKKLSLGGLGISGEIGEAAEVAVEFLTVLLRLSAAGSTVADTIKKVLHHEVPVDTVRDKLKKELGDVRWYLEYVEATLGLTREEVEEANVAKLKARHPNGWTPQSQQAKADEA